MLPLTKVKACTHSRLQLSNVGKQVLCRPITNIAKFVVSIADLCLDLCTFFGFWVQSHEGCKIGDVETSNMQVMRVDAKRVPRLCFLESMQKAQCRCPFVHYCLGAWKGSECLSRVRLPSYSQAAPGLQLYRDHEKRRTFYTHASAAHYIQKQLLNLVFNLSHSANCSLAVHDTPNVALADHQLRWQ